MILKPNVKTRLCLNTACPKRHTCWRFVKGGDTTVGEFFAHEWIEDCDNFNKYIQRSFFSL